MKKITLLLTAVLVLSAVTLYAQSAQTHFDNGKRLYDQDKDDEAIQEFTAAIRLNPNMAEAYAYRGRLYSYRRDYDRAISDFEAALRINPNLNDTKADLASAKEAQQPKNTRDDALAEWMLNELDRRVGNALAGGGGSSSSSGSSSGRAARGQYHVQGSFTATVNNKITTFTIKEFVLATSQNDAREQVEKAIRNQYPTANNINITRIYGP